MWGMLYSNRKCNEFEQFHLHKSYLERIVNSKSTVKPDSPKKPKFLFNRSKKKQIENEKNNKIQYENDLIMKKIIHLGTHDTEYHPKKIIIKDCPAFDKTKITNYNEKVIHKENYSLFKRLLSAKPTYSTSSNLREYNKNKYYENLILQNKNSDNPNLKFDTPFNFRRKLDGYINTQLIKSQVDFGAKLKQRPMSSAVGKVNRLKEM